MNTWAEPETFRREVEAARRLGRGVVEHFQALHEARGWNGSDDD